MIACKPSFPPYLAALNPTDQVFDFEELEYHYLVANRTEDAPSKDDEEDDDEDGAGGGDGKTEKSDHDKEKNSLMDEHQVSPLDTIQDSPQLKSPTIDNPFLKAAKVPKRNKLEASVSLNFWLKSQIDFLRNQDYEINELICI